MTPKRLRNPRRSYVKRGPDPTRYPHPTHGYNATVLNGVLTTDPNRETEAAWRNRILGGNK